MSKDVRILRVLEETNNLLTNFLMNSNINSSIQDQLFSSITAISDLSVTLSDLLPKVVNPVNDKELEFCEKIQQVAQYGIQKNHKLVVEAAEHLVTYLREKIALIRIAMEAANPSAPNP